MSDCCNNNCCEEVKACLTVVEDNIKELFKRTDELAAMLEGSGNIMTVAVISDFGTESSDPQYIDTATLVNAMSPDAVITAGDNVYPDGDASDVADRFSLYQDLINEEKFFPALGNHDQDNVGSPGQPVLNHFPYLPKNSNNHSRYYRKYFPEWDTEFFIVNSGWNSSDIGTETDGNTVGSDQYLYFVEALNDSVARWKIVVFHHPYITSVNAGSAKTPMDWGWQELPVDLIINGHSHLPEHWRDTDGLDIINAGSGYDGRVVTGTEYGKTSCTRVWAGAANGFTSPEVAVKLTIHPTYIIVTYYKVDDGQAIYAFQIT